MPFDPKKLDNYPIQPGVYLMKNQEGHVLYVGKAKNLRARLKQYFISGGDGRFMVPYLVAKVESVDVIIVHSEKEALLLENTLIKQHQPKYNALLKDDKSYLALRVTQKQQWPKLELVRYKGKPPTDSLNFGPFTSAVAAKTTFDLLNKLFPLRQCSDQEFARRTRPCILYDMKRCIAPCVGKCTKEEYDNYVQRTIKFLRGQDKEILDDLYKEMLQAAEALHFEKAQELLNRIRQLEKTIEVQKVDKLHGSNSDVLAIFRQGEEVLLCQLQLRGGKLIDSRHYVFSKIAQDDEELLASFLLQIYETLQEMPEEILLPDVGVESEAIGELISKGKRRKTTVYAPKRGEKKALVDMAKINAEEAFKREHDEQTLREKALVELQNQLHLKNYPRRIECFDNSHTSGGSTVSSLVAFTDGMKDSSRYRKYKIKEAAASDDYAAMREVLTRRCQKGLVEGDLPDLILVDGGKGHLNAVLQILANLNIVTVDVVGVAKEAGRHDKGSSAEQFFLPNIKDPIILKSSSPILYLVQKIRDEAHRTAITYHRKLRSKNTIKTALSDIPGIGPKKLKVLLTHFGSVKRIREASEEELKSVKGISIVNAAAIIKHFR
jgi:excinuclease ABC subunit C